MVKKITKSDLPPIPSIDRMANKINENFESIEGAAQLRAALPAAI